MRSTTWRVEEPIGTRVDAKLRRSRPCRSALRKEMIGARLANELSNLVAGCGRKYAPSKISMIVILPPQHGHCGGSPRILVTGAASRAERER
jgi:hypothetical protein